MVEQLPAVCTAPLLDGPHWKMPYVRISSTSTTECFVKLEFSPSFSQVDQNALPTYGGSCRRVQGRTHCIRILDTAKSRQNQSRSNDGVSRCSPETLSHAITASVTGV